MAPEATRGAAEPRSDLYALGCVGYWLVTGLARVPASHGDGHGGRAFAERT